MQKTTRITLSVVLLLGLIMLPVSSVMAADKVVLIAADQTREGSTFLAGDKVRIDGTINGDLYVAAETIYVNGPVNGDIIGAARDLIISGPVQGDVRAVAQTIRLKGPVAGSATVGSEALYLEKHSAVTRDLVALSSTSNLDGTINGSVFAWAENLFLTGSVGKNVNAHVNMLNVTDGASIGGNLAYVSSSEGLVSENAQIGGSRVWKPEAAETAGKQDSPWSIGGFLISLAGILIIYWLVKVWRPQIWESLARPAREHVLSAAGIGLLLLFAVPILAVLVMVTVVGIPLGIIILLTYGVLLYVSRLIVSLYLADLLKTKYNWQEPWLWFAVLVAVLLVVHAPYIGWVISIVVLALGLGCGFYALFGKKNNSQTDIPETVV